MQTIEQALQQIDELVEQSRYADAYVAARQLAKKQRGSAEAHAKYADILLLGVRIDPGNSFHAARELRRAISLSPDVWEYHVKLAETLREIGEISLSEASSLRALDLTMRLGNPEFFERIGKSLEYHPAAIEAYKLAIELDESRENCYAGLAVVLAGLKRFDEGLEVCDAWMAKFPVSAFSLLTKAKHFQGLGRYDEASAASMKVIARIENGDAPFDNNTITFLSQAKRILGKAQLSLSHPQDAARWFAESLQLASDEEQTRCDLGAAYAAMESISAAVLQWRLATRPVESSYLEGNASVRAHELLTRYVRSRQNIEDTFWRLPAQSSPEQRPPNRTFGR